jgi:hypothetical protein
MYDLLCVLISILPGDIPLGSKHVAINTTTKVVLPVFTPLTEKGSWENLQNHENIVFLNTITG